MTRRENIIKSWFGKRNLVIATKHKKESVIAPLLEKQLGVKCIVPENIDTDTLGTFTGEIERIEIPYLTAIKKCELAMELSGADLAVASEGSFGAHPIIFFTNANEEMLVMVDKKNDLKVVASELSLETNFNATEVKSVKQLEEFANKVGFPSHGLIVRGTKNSFEPIWKGITNWAELIEVFYKTAEIFGRAYIETDMRAMYNPTRLAVIQKATHALIEKLNSLCPSCNTPGFGVTEVKPGLPCQTCAMPTKGPLYHVYMCSKCNHTKGIRYPNGIKFQDPMYCDFCNP